MAFNADAWVEATTPPEFQVRRRRFVGRILSADEWFRLHANKNKVLAGVEAAKVSPAGHDSRAILRDVRNTTRDFIASWFPAPWYARPVVWVFGNGWNPAWRCFKRLPEKVQLEAIKDFCECQRNAMPYPVGAGEGTAPLAPAT